jgi:hypothetical protein
MGKFPLWVLVFAAFFFPGRIYAQDSGLRFSQQFIEIRGEVDAVLIRDLDGDKMQEIIFQQGRDLTVYRLSAVSSGTEFARSFVCSLPEDVCIYDITDLPQAGIFYINRQGVNSLNWLSRSVLAKPVLLFPCPTVFRREKFNTPLNKKMLFTAALAGPGESTERWRVTVVPDHGKFRIVPFDEVNGGLRSDLATELPVAATGYVYNSNGLFEPLTAEVSLPVFSLADLNNDRINDFITLIGNNVYAFIGRINSPDADGLSACYAQAGPAEFSFKPAEHLLSIPQDAVSQDIDFGYTLAPIIRDINKDGYADIMFSDDREGVVYIYMNRFASDKIFYAKTPSQIIRTNNWIIEHNLIDLNGDGLEDLVLVQMNKLGVMGGLQAILAKTLEWEIAVYLARPDSNTAGEVYSKSPDYVRSIKLPFSFSYSSSLSLGRSLPKIKSPYIWSLSGDFNGDKILDLLLSGTESQMSIYPGDKQRIFNKDILASLNLLSANQGYKLMGMPYGAPIISDLNHDGKSDIIIPLVRQDSAGLVSQAYEILLSR